MLNGAGRKDAVKGVVCISKYPPINVLNHEPVLLEVIWGKEVRLSQHQARRDITPRPWPQVQIRCKDSLDVLRQVVDRGLRSSSDTEGRRLTVQRPKFPQRAHAHRNLPL